MNTYKEKLKEVQNVFCGGVRDLITVHFNSFLDRYGNWKKYPRKIKKRLKKSLLWEYRYSEKIEKDKLEVKVNDRFL